MMILFAGNNFRQRLPFYILVFILASIFTIQFNQVLVAQDIANPGQAKGPSGLKAVMFLGVSLWEWIKVSFGPTVLGLISVFLRQFLAEQDKKKKKQQAEIARKAQLQEKEITEDRLRHEKLKDYLDHMTGVLLRENTLDDETDELLKAVVRARTIVVLQELEGKRKGAVIRFLEDCNVIKFLDLAKADLQEANLKGVNLSSTCFRKASFQGANLQDADLSNANLVDADLTNANLSGANLLKTNLKNAQGLTLKQIQTADNWQQALYDENLS
ncbi:MAG: pentapeptide repeat-containing protein [Xenococcus sp. (in: cyanobacteria)]